MKWVSHVEGVCGCFFALVFLVLHLLLIGFASSTLCCIRVTSYRRLRARDHYTSSTHVGGKGGDGPNLLHTTLVGSTEYLNARWMSSLYGFLYGIERIMFHGLLHYFQKPLLGGRPNAKPTNHGTLNVHNRWFILFYHVWGAAWIEIHWNSIRLRAMSIYDFTLYLRVHNHTTWVWRCVGTAFWHFLLGSHNFIVATLSSCVKWPLAYMLWNINKILFGKWTSPH